VGGKRSCLVGYFSMFCSIPDLTYCLIEGGGTVWVSLFS